MKIFKIIKKYSKELTFGIIGIIAITFLLNYIRSLIPLYIGKVFGILDYTADSTLPGFINDLFTGKSVQTQLILVMVCIILTALVRDSVNVLSDFSIAYVSNGIGYNIQTDFYNHVQALPYSYLSRAETGDLIQRSTSDINRVKNFIGESLPQILTCVLQIIIYATQMLIIDLELGSILLCFVPIIFIVAIIFHKKMGNTFKDMEENEGKLTSTVQENLTGIRVVKAFANENVEIDKFNDRMNKYTSVWKKMMNRLTTYWATGDLFTYGMLLLAFILGVVFIKDGKLSLSKVISIFLYVEYIMWPTRFLGRLIGEMSRTDVACGRILEITEMETEFSHGDGKEKPEIKGEIEFDNVFFKYKKDGLDVIHDLNLKIKQGETIALFGKTGSGKSTLVNMLNRMLDPTSGTIRIDGVDITNINRKHLRKNVGIVLQEPFLFSTTIAENIGVVLEQKDMKKIQEVAEIASVRSDIERFDAGYDTVVGERGVTLSGGQKQRISIARTIVEKKPILVFDDSLSAVDTETDVKIRKALHARQSMATTIIITHRISTAMDADRIVVLDNGTVSESGTFDELIKKDGLIKNIWEIQNYFEDGKAGEK